MKHFGLAINLKDDPEIIEKYKEYHSNVWPEVLESLHTIGITKMNIYLLGRRMFMAMEAIDEFEVEKISHATLNSIRAAVSGMS